MNNKTMEIDLIGQYYTSINNSKSPGVFALSVYLKESIQPKILQQAANDLFRRLPFLNGRVKKGFFHYQYEILRALAKIESDGKEPLFSDYYNKGSHHMIKIVYGKQHFTVKATHSICDGRGLSKFTSALLVHYFELLGMDLDRGDVIDCNGKFTPEEAEDAAKRYMTAPPKNFKKKTDSKATVYRVKSPKSSTQQFLTQSFDAGRIKAAAKAHDATINQYLLAHIFSVIAKKRDVEGGTGRITGSVQIDCRSFFESKTLRSFVTAATVFKIENKDFSKMVKHIKNQFNEITKDSVWEKLYEQQKMYQNARFVPRVLKVLAMKMIARMEAGKSTTGISNLGLIKLPAEIESRIKRIEFPIAIEQGYSNFFSCATIGNTLALTATFREEGRDIVEAVMKTIGDIGNGYCD